MRRVIGNVMISYGSLVRCMREYGECTRTRHTNNVKRLQWQTPTCPHPTCHNIVITYYVLFYRWADCKHIALQHVLGFACAESCCFRRVVIRHLLSAFVRFCRRKKIPALNSNENEDKIAAILRLNPCFAIPSRQKTVTQSMAFIKTVQFMNYASTSLVGNIQKTLRHWMIHCILVALLRLIWFQRFSSHRNVIVAKVDRMRLICLTLEEFTWKHTPSTHATSIS